jgi:hypothetical protein
MLHIMTVFGDAICEHMISTGRGMLIKNPNHGRNRNETLEQLVAATDALLCYKAHDFLQRLHTEKPRYTRDQLKLIETLCSDNVCQGGLSNFVA